MGQPFLVGRPNDHMSTSLVSVSKPETRAIPQTMVCRTLTCVLAATNTMDSTDKSRVDAGFYVHIYIYIYRGYITEVLV